MKRYLLIFFLTIFVTACNKKAGSPNYFCTAIINNEPWKQKHADAIPSTYLSSEAIDIRFDGNFKGYNHSFIVLNIKKNLLSTQQIRKSASNDPRYSLRARFHTMEESDVTGDRYDILESDSLNNWIEVIKAKKDFTRGIEGRFSATFVRTRAFKNSPFPDTIRIREGYFYIAKVGKG